MIFTIHYSNIFGFQVLLKRVFVIDHRVVYDCLMHPANFIICAHIKPRTTSLTRQWQIYVNLQLHVQYINPLLFICLEIETLIHCNVINFLFYICVNFFRKYTSPTKSKVISVLYILESITSVRFILFKACCTSSYMKNIPWCWQLIVHPVILFKGILVPSFVWKAR